jgi:glycosyltransferase involved in cell wall biosynthesis
MLVKALKQNCHLYHFHDPELLLVGYLLKLFGKKVIYDVHEDLPKQIYNKNYLPKILIPIISTIIKFLENFFCKKFDGVITVVPTINNRLLKSNSNTIMFRNFPDINLVDSAKVLKKNKNISTIIYPGSLSKKRGVEDAINLVNLYKGGIKLILAGSWESEAFHRKCKQLDGWKYVKFLGRVSQKKIYSYIKSSDLGIHLIHDMPSSRIGYPMKAFEFMACKIPFIISEVGNKKKLFKNSCSYVKPGDLKDIQKKVNYILKNKKYGKKLAQNGRKRVIQLYNLEIEFNNLLKFYKKILN